MLLITETQNIEEEMQAARCYSLGDITAISDIDIIRVILTVLELG